MKCPIFCNHGRCYKCRKPWCEVDPHITNYSDGRGCFPLCIQCWGSILPEERIPYYEQLFEDWCKDVRPPNKSELNQILVAVKTGL